jgi:hypothetical protein
MTATTLKTDTTERASERAGFRNIAALRARDLNRREAHGAPRSTYWEEIVDGEEVIVFEVNVPEVIYLDSQLEQRAAAAEADRTNRHSALAERAAKLLAAIDEVRAEAQGS